MRVFDRQGAADFLRTQGVSGETEIDRILDGFDFDRPVYEQSFWQGDSLYQLIRMPSASLPSPNVGNWFGVAGMTTNAVAINDGVSGRRAGGFGGGEDRAKSGEKGFLHGVGLNCGGGLDGRPIRRRIAAPNEERA